MYEFKIWVIGITRAVKTRNALDFYMNLDNKKLASSLFNSLAIYTGPEEFEKMQGYWDSQLINSDYYKMWSNLQCLPNIIVALGIQFEYRLKEKNITIPIIKENIFNNLWIIYEKLKSSMKLSDIFIFDETELEYLTQVEYSHQCELVFGSPHRYEKYNKFWNCKREDYSGEIFIEPDDSE